jgi:CRP-like cAMP-binding protein
MEKSKSLQELKAFASSIHTLSDAEWTDFASIWQEGKAKRKTILTTRGETEKNLYFITDGVQRAYYLSENDKEATIIFTYPFSFSGVADSFLTQTPSNYFFETLTESEFLKTSHTQIAALLDRYPNLERFISKATAFALKGALERQVELQTFSAEQKFTKLLTRSPHVLRLISHKYLASYLGMDAATFSKLLSTVRI